LTFKVFKQYSKRMASRIENIIRTAIHTFSKTPIGSITGINGNRGENIQILLQLLSDVTSEDVGLALEKKCLSPQSVTYVEIFENQRISVGIFIVKEGACIPLHDHSGMVGLLKLLQGNMKLQSYTPLDSNYSSNTLTIEANKSPTTLLTEKDGIGVLFPTEHNIHELQAIDGPASFLDILSPPYNSHDRDCNFWKEIGTAAGVSTLQRIPCPSSFTCDRMPYSGPSVKHLLEKKKNSCQNIM